MRCDVGGPVLAEAMILRAGMRMHLREVGVANGSSCVCVCACGFVSLLSIRQRQVRVKNPAPNNLILRRMTDSVSCQLFFPLRDCRFIGLLVQVSRGGLDRCCTLLESLPGVLRDTDLVSLHSSARLLVEPYVKIVRSS